MTLTLRLIYKSSMIDEPTTSDPSVTVWESDFDVHPAAEDVLEGYEPDYDYGYELPDIDPELAAELDHHQEEVQRLLKRLDFLVDQIANCEDQEALQSLKLYAKRSHADRYGYRDPDL